MFGSTEDFATRGRGFGSASCRPQIRHGCGSPSACLNQDLAGPHTTKPPSASKMALKISTRLVVTLSTAIARPEPRVCISYLYLPYRVRTIAPNRPSEKSQLSPLVRLQTISPDNASSGGKQPQELKPHKSILPQCLCHLLRLERLNIWCHCQVAVFRMEGEWYAGPLILTRIAKISTYSRMLNSVSRALVVSPAAIARRFICWVVPRNRYQTPTS
jgi:hypothetical protein